MKTYMYRASNLKSIITFLASISDNFWRPLKSVVSCDLFIFGRELASPTLGCSIEISRDIGQCSSTLSVGLAYAVSPTNTNFRRLSMKT